MTENKIIKGSLVKVKRDIYTENAIIPVGMQGVITEQINLNGLGDIIKIFFENGLYASLCLNNDYIKLVPEVSTKELEWMSTEIKDGIEKIKNGEERIKSLHKIELCKKCHKELTEDNRWNSVSPYCKDCTKVRLYDKATELNITDGNIIDRNIDNVLDGLFDKIRHNLKSRVSDCLKGYRD